MGIGTPPALASILLRTTSLFLGLDAKQTPYLIVPLSSFPSPGFFFLNLASDWIPLVPTKGSLVAPPHLSGARTSWTYPGYDLSGTVATHPSPSLLALHVLGRTVAVLYRVPGGIPCLHCTHDTWPLPVVVLALSHCLIHCVLFSGKSVW
jgi:hypothetical protein